MPVRRFAVICLLTVVTALMVSSAGFGSVMYVKQDSPGPVFDGRSWETAFHNVRDAVTAAGDAVSEIWVAKGTYVENIYLYYPISLYGGFAGNETDKSQSDPQANKTILDGGGKGAVVEYYDANFNPHVDGFTIRNGRYEGIRFGGYNYGYSSVCGVVSDCIITDNSFGTASAIYSKGALQVRNCKISHNGIAASVIYAQEADIANCTISDNDSTAILYEKSVVVDRCTISNNRSGIQQIQYSSTSEAYYVRVTNCTISNNSGYDSLNQSAEGGAIYFNKGGTPSTGGFDCIIASNIITGNNAPGLLGAVHIKNASVSMVNNSIALNGLTDEGAANLDQCTGTVANNIVANNTSGIKWSGGTLSFSNNCVYENKAFNYSGGDDPTGTQGNISQDPKFAAMMMGDLHIRPGSPCIDAGNDDAATVVFSDIDGHIRVWGDHVDIGADESNGAVWPEKQVGVVYVSPQGDDDNDGSSWSKAKKTVQAGIDAASDKVGEVWTAAGTYNEHITLKPNAWLYGGFAGTETDKSQRDWKANKTVIDGTPAQGEDGGTVVTALGIPCNLSCLDGFTIRGGTGRPIPLELTGLYEYCGGGIYCSCATISVANNVITANRANYGAGIYCTGSGVVVVNNRFAENEAYRTDIHTVYIDNGYGGAVYSSGGIPVVAGNVITTNSATRGGAVYCDGAITIANNTIVDNLAAGYIEAIYCGDNLSIIRNNIIAYNSAGIYNAGTSSPTLQNNCVFGNIEYAYSGATVQPAHPTDIEQNPGFASIEYGNLHIQPGSPCVDAGFDDPKLSASQDMDNQPRIQGDKIDIGADESDGTAWTIAPAIIRVCPNGSDNNDGSSWEQAKKTVHAAVAALAGTGGEVWVHAGTYYTAGSPLGTLVVPNCVFLYGGFNGTETQRSQRQWTENETILAGDKNAAGYYGSVAEIGKYSVWTRVDGFTIRDGNAEHAGGGICCDPSTRPVIANNRIMNNSAGSSGDLGQARCGGGGIYGDIGSYPTITGNIIAKNSSVVDGGAICLFSGICIACNTIADNTAPFYHAAAVACYAGVDVVDNIIAFNNCAYPVPGNRPYNNCIYGTPYDGYTSPDPDGNIYLDPLFVDRQAGDYHLLPISPCLDAGTASGVPLPEFDIDGESRVSFDIVDIGADECGKTPECLGQVKLLKPNDKVRCSGIVTAVFGSQFYIESPNRSSAIMVTKSNHGLVVGDSVLVYGGIQLPNSEKQIYATKIVVLGKGHIEPVLMSNRTVGGADFRYDATAKTGQIGLKNGTGLNTVGLLVSTTGRVVKTGTRFYIDDGSGVQDDPLNMGMVVVLPTGLTAPAQGSYVTVTGISSLLPYRNTSGGGLQRSIKPRSQDDITVLQQ